MSNAEAQPPEPLEAADLFDILRALCRDYVVSDLRLLSESLSALRRPSAEPIRGLIMAPSIEARLSFDSTFTKTRGFVFRPRRRDRSERVAEFDVDLKVTPAPDPTAARSERVQMVGVWPRFVKKAHSDGWLELQLDDSDGFRLDVSGSDSDADHLSAAQIVQLTSAIARWIRLRDNSGPAPFTPAPSAPLDAFLGMLAKQVKLLLRDVSQILIADDPANRGDDDEELRRISAYRAYIATIIGPDHSSYQLAKLAGRLRAILTPAGELATKPFAKGNRRFDIEARLADADDHSNVIISLNIPDFLVSGALYRGILDAVSKSEAVKAFAIPSPLLHLLPNRAAVINSIRAAGASENGVVARVVRNSSGTDLDMILIKGVGPLRDCWMLFMFNVSFADRSASDMRVDKISKLRLAVFFERGGLTWMRRGKDRDVLAAYFHRAFRALHGWRMRFQPAGNPP